MPDITMCRGRSQDLKKTCQKRGQCYRYTATPNEYGQSWFMGMPCDEFACESFIMDKGKSIVLRDK